MMKIFFHLELVRNIILKFLKYFANLIFLQKKLHSQKISQVLSKIFLRDYLEFMRIFITIISKKLFHWGKKLI